MDHPPSLSQEPSYPRPIPPEGCSTPTPTDRTQLSGSRTCSHSMRLTRAASSPTTPHSRPPSNGPSPRSHQGTAQPQLQPGLWSPRRGERTCEDPFPTLQPRRQSEAVAELVSQDQTRLRASRSSKCMNKSTSNPDWAWTARWKRKKEGKTQQVWWTLTSLRLVKHLILT